MVLGTRIIEPDGSNSGKMLSKAWLRYGMSISDILTRALMGSGELHVLMGGGPKGPLRIFKSKSRRVKIQTALERSRRTLQDTIMLTLFFDL